MPVTHASAGSAPSHAAPGRVVVVPCLLDNYAYVIMCERTGQAAVVDPSEASPVVAALERLEAERPLELVGILNTHHHHDHVGGNAELVAREAARGRRLRVLGHRHDANHGRIPGQTEAIEEGTEVRIGDLAARTWHVPGHTLGAITYDFGPAVGAFTGDTLFLAGCGRLFEGTASMMQASLAKLAAQISPDTPVYPGHEYTEKNLEFALSVEPGSPVLKERLSRVVTARQRQEPTAGARFAEELATNPFLRVTEPALKEAARKADPDSDGSPASVFGTLRRLKDHF